MRSRVVKTGNENIGGARRRLAGLALAAWAAAWPGGASAVESSVQPRAGIANCEVTAPSGDYALVILHFDVPEASHEAYAKWTLLGGLRGGQMRVDDGVGLREPGGWLTLKDGKLSGTFRRNHSGAGGRLDFVRVTVDAAVEEGAVSGTVQIDGVNGTVTGRMIPEVQQGKRNPVARDKNWPAAQGPTGGGCSAQPTGALTVDTVSDLRVIWKSEETDIGQAMSPLTRFMNTWRDASTLRTSSGCASPVVADGRVFFKYFIPRPGEPKPAIPGFETQQDERAAGQAMLQAARQAGYAERELPVYAREKICPAVDDVVLCMDAATGKTLWKAVIKGRGINSQHHKAGPFDMSPAYGEGKVFALGMSGWLYAFDADTGRPLWEAKSELDYSNALLVSDGVVVAPAQNQWGGYDVNTGRLLWTAGGGRGVSTLSRWVHGNQEYLIGRMGPRHEPGGIVCLESRTGKEMWTLPVNVITGGRGLGPGGISVFGDRLLVCQNNGTGEKNAEIEPVIAAYRLTPAKPEPLWQADHTAAGEHGRLGCVHGESVPVVVLGRFVFGADLSVIDLETGKKLGQSIGIQPGNGGYMQAIEDLVMVRRDGTHGRIECGFYKVTPDGDVRCLTATGWSPPVGGHTTSYHHPIFYPMVDGRMFLRQYDGVYCWDLRKTPAMIEVEEALRTIDDRPSAAFDALSALSRDPDPAVRAMAGRSLAERVASGQWAERKRDVLALLGDFASCPDPPVRLAVVEALAALGTDALPLMIETADHESAAARITAMQAAGLMPDVTDPIVNRVLERGLRDGTRSVIDAALDATASRGESAIPLTPALSKLAASDEPNLLQKAVGVILLIHPAGQLPAELPPNFEAGLIANLSVWGQDTLMLETLDAIRALGREEALRIYGSVLKGDDPVKGLRACHGLGAMGAEARPAIPLIEAAKTKWGGSRTFVGSADNALQKIRKGR